MNSLLCSFFYTLNQEVTMKIGEIINRVDSIEKINGEAKYIEDIKFKNLHYARTLRSSIAKGEIVSINYPEIPDGLWIIDAKDTYKNEVYMIQTDMPIFAKKDVNYIGEPLALIVGKNKNLIIEFMKNIKIEYKEDIGIFSIDECRNNKERIFTTHKYGKGDIANIEYDEIFERKYSTGYQEQLYMEKQGLVGDYKDGILTIWGSLQCPYYIKNALINS